MKLADPNNLPKKPRKPRALKGGEPFEAEPGATEASETWKQAQLARLILRNEAGGIGVWNNAWPTLDAMQDWNLKNNKATSTMQWDEEEEKYYTKTFYRFKVQFRRYRGSRQKSYLFWPQIVVPGYNLSRQDFVEQRVEVVVPTGSATYVRLGALDQVKDYYGRGQEVWGLWKSNGTMKERRKSATMPSQATTALTSV